MQKCKSCERKLQGDEEEFCPACASSKSHKIKKIIEIAVPIAIAIGGIAFKLLRRK
jgi:reverse gyrase